MRYRLRTLLIVLAIAPPLGAIAYQFWVRHLEWQAVINQSPNEANPFLPVIQVSP